MTQSTQSSLLCHHCRYDLRGMPAGQCPECGTPFDPAILSDVLIPWERRREIGRIRAYFATARDVTFHPSRIASRLDHPISMKHARSFRRTTALLLILILAITVGVNLWINFSRTAGMTYWNTPLQSITDLWPLLAGSPWSAGAIFLGGAIAIFLIADLPRPFFAWRDLPDPQRRRSEAVGCYACAGLALLCIPAVVAPAIIAMTVAAYGMLLFLNDLLLSRTFIAIAAVGAAWCASSAILLRFTTRCSIARCIAVGVFLSIAAPLLLFFCLFFCLAATNLIAAMWVTAR